MTDGKKYKPIKTFSYARRVKAVKPGRVNYFRFQGKRIKAFVSPDGRTLQVLEAPKSIIPEIVKADKLMPCDGRLRIIEKKPEPPRPELKPEPPPPRPVEEPTPKAEPEPEPSPPPPPPMPQPVQPFEKKPHQLSEAERRKAKLVPVPDSGLIPTPYIDWDSIPQSCRVSGIAHHDYPVPGAPKGMLPALREMFKRSRRYQDEVPVNIVIQGPKGSGKSQLIKKFAEETGLPYWGVIGQEGIRADELLGRYKLENGRSVWMDGIIPRAVRAGGILHIDESNVIEPAILMRLDELLDNKRQLNMEDLNGEIVKAHPDLFVIFTMNPPTYEGVKPLPDPIISRLTKRFVLNYPPQHVEYKIIEAKLRGMGIKSAEFGAPASPHASPTGRYAQDITDFMKIINGLRADTELTYTPSIRETIGFVQDLREGDDFFTAFDNNVKNWYTASPEEADKVEEALKAVRRR